MVRRSRVMLLAGSLAVIAGVGAVASGDAVGQRTSSRIRSSDGAAAAVAPDATGGMPSAGSRHADGTPRPESPTGPVAVQPGSGNAAAAAGPMPVAVTAGTIATPVVATAGTLSTAPVQRHRRAPVADTISAVDPLVADQDRWDGDAGRVGPRAVTREGPGMVIHQPEVPVGFTWTPDDGPCRIEVEPGQTAWISLHGDGASHATVDGRPAIPGMQYPVTSVISVQGTQAVGIHVRPGPATAPTASG